MGTTYKLKVGLGFLGRGFTKLPRLPAGGCLQKGGSGEEGRGGGGEEGRGGSGGGVSRVGGIAEVQRRDDGRNWTARIALRVERAFPFHPRAPVLRCVGDRGTDRGRR